MDPVQKKTSPDPPAPTEVARFAWVPFALWLPTCLAIGVAVAWAADVAQSDLKFAPVVIFPLLLGGGLGAIAVGLMRLGQVGNRTTILLGTLLAVSVAVAAQHYAAYLTACRWRGQKITAEQLPGQDLSVLAKVSTPSFAEFMRRQADRGRPPLTDRLAPAAVAPVTWASWGVDGLLVLAGALAMVVPAMRLPFCNRCRSWYRIAQSGRIDGQTARRLAETVGVCPEDRPSSARYRLLSCNGGCGPTSFELSWQRRRGPGFSIQAWLDAEQRDRVTRALDTAKQKAAGSVQ